MSSLRKAAGAYLTDIGQEQAPELGARPRRVKGLDTFQQRLLEEQRFNRNIFALIVLLLTALFAVGIYLVLKNQNQPLIAGTFLGADLVSFLLIIKWMRQTLLDKIYADLLVRASNELDSDHLAKFVATWYELTTKAHPQTQGSATKRNKSEQRAQP